jgi:hypothetical protein
MLEFHIGTLIFQLMTFLIIGGVFAVMIFVVLALIRKLNSNK